MTEDEDRPAEAAEPSAANDSGAARLRVDTAVLRIARLIGRQIAREEFERLNAANDNQASAPPKDRPRR